MEVVAECTGGKLRSESGDAGNGRKNEEGK